MYFIISMFFIIGLLTTVLAMSFGIGYIISLFNRCKYRNNRGFYKSRRRW